MVLNVVDDWDRALWLQFALLRRADAHEGCAHKLIDCFLRYSRLNWGQVELFGKQTLRVGAQGL
ncbi:MAG: hypothetical protein DLM53_07470 [Candidatus Eremiobacter antarcticus]|nr:MAG: hypothetical protein DLM53_07470 [Candidatus Eremiobacter sp. RRmetagenome_bin22]